MFSVRLRRKICNPEAKHNLLKGQRLIRAKVPGFSTSGEIPVSAISRGACSAKKPLVRTVVWAALILPDCLTEYQWSDLFVLVKPEAILVDIEQSNLGFQRGPCNP
jgi:hypothetical protein